MMTSSARAPVAAWPARRLPGDVAMWIFILAELSVFGILIFAFAVTQALHETLFHESRLLLDRSTGLALTAGLLTSGLLAALAVAQVRQGRQRGAMWLLLCALASACVYVALKLHEYGHLLQMGLDVEHNRFFALYWILTGFHFLHVLLGMVILGWMANRCRLAAYGAGQLAPFESGVLYWHMVDLVWVILFPVVYVMN